MATIGHAKCNMPLFGLGLWKVSKEVCADVVYSAIKIGVRHLDCACDYGNEAETGIGITRAINEGIVTREDLFITSKLWNTYHREEHVFTAAKRSLLDLNIHYFDLYLVHFPISMKFVPFETRYPPSWVFDPTSPNPIIEVDDVPLSETWRAMEELVLMGITRNIGVCNTSVSLMMDLLSYSKISPAVNQVELHPRNSQKALVAFCQSRGIHVTGFSPLGSPSYIELNMDGGEGQGLLADPILLGIAAAHSKSAAQVMLRWNVQRGVSVVSKSSQITRIAENLDIFDFELSATEIEAIDSLNKNQRYNDPGEFCKGMGGAIPIYN